MEPADGEAMVEALLGDDVAKKNVRVCKHPPPTSSSSCCAAPSAHVAFACCSSLHNHIGYVQSTKSYRLKTGHDDIGQVLSYVM